MPKKQDLPARIRQVLEQDKKLRQDTIIDVSLSGIRNNIHVLVISRALDELSEAQKQEYLWDLLDDAVKRKEMTKAELQRISLVLPLSVQELRR